MGSITISALDAARKDVEFIADIANSKDFTATNRDGKVCLTIAGINDDIAKSGANSAGRLFPSKEAGIAAVGSGQTFSVLSYDGLSIIIYKNANGFAQEQLRMPTSERMEVLEQDQHNRTDFVWGILDEKSALAIGIRKDGRVVFGVGGDIFKKIEDQNERLPDEDLLKYSRSGFTWAVIDSEEKIAIGLDLVGDFWSKGQNLTARAAQTKKNSDDLIFLKKWVTPAPDIVCWGDSLTQSEWPAMAATRLGRTFINNGIGGQISTEIAARQGALAALVTISGNTIPASGSVNVTLTMDGAAFSPLWDGQKLPGSIDNVKGTLNRAGNQYSFTRGIPGDPWGIDVDTPFVVDTLSQDFSTTVFFVGHNNVFKFPQKVISDVTKMINFLKPIDKRFIVMTCVSGDWADRYKGTPQYDNLLTFNRFIRDSYPCNYIDIFGLLLRNFDPNVPQDLIDVANGVHPSSLRHDAIHLNTKGNSIVADAVVRFIQQKGW